MEDFSAEAYRKKLKENGVFHTDGRLAEIMKNYGKMNPKNVYDPTCGVGSLLSAFDDDIPKYGQELEESYLNEAKKSLRNFTGALGNTLTTPAFMDMKFDLIVANYPFSVKWEPAEEDIRFKDWCTVPPPSKADFAFIMHMMYLLADDGICVCLSFPGILYRGAREGKIRAELVTRGYVKKVIQIPGGYFKDTNIATSLLILSKAPTDGFVEFEDLQLNKSIRVSLDEIKRNDFNLAVSNYIFEDIQKECIDPIANSNECKHLFLKNLKDSLEFYRIDAELQSDVLGRKEANNDFFKLCDDAVNVIKKFALEIVKTG